MKKDNTVYDLYNEQPEECRQPLPFKEIIAPEFIRNLFLLNPTFIYDRVRYKIKPRSRYNYINFFDLFPNGTVDTLPGSTPKERQKLAVAVWEIISGIPDKIRYYLRFYYGNNNCVKCGEPGVDLDHRIPLKGGGGGCWMSNFDILCLSCHAKKTAKENGWAKSKHLKDE